MCSWFCISVGDGRSWLTNTGCLNKLFKRVLSIYLLLLPSGRRFPRRFPWYWNCNICDASSFTFQAASGIKQNSSWALCPLPKPWTERSFWHHGAVTGPVTAKWWYMTNCSLTLDKTVSQNSRALQNYHIAFDKRLKTALANSGVELVFFCLHLMCQHYFFKKLLNFNEENDFFTIQFTIL